MSDIGILRIPVVPNLAGFGAKVKAEVGAVGKEAEKSIAPATASVTRLGGAYDKAGIAAAKASIQMQQSALRVTAAQDRAAAATSRAAKASAEAAAASQKLFSGEISVAGAADKQAAAAERAAAATNAQARASLEARRAAILQAEAQGRATEAAVAGQKRALAAIGSVAAGVGKASAVAVVAFAGYGVKAASDFQKLTNVYVTAAGESQKNLKTVQDGVKRVAENTGTAWKDVAAATYLAEKAGIRGADTYKVVEAAAQGAKEENAQLATVTQGLTSVMASYHLKAGDAVSITNQLKTASGEAKTTFEDYVGSLSTVLPIASAAHISLADVLGIVSQLTQHGTSAAESTQEVAFAIRNLNGGNAVASKEMAQLGINSVDVAQKLGDGPGGRGLAGTINYLSRTVLEKLGPSGTLLLSTFNASQQAAKDAQTEFAALPPQAQKLADAYRTGSVSLKDYRTGLKALPADQAALVQQFVATENGAKGFQQAIKNGGPAAQTYSQALQKMLGGVNGLNVALQTSGKSSDETAARIKKIADAAKNAGTSVQGWQSTQKLFSTQLDEFKQKVEVAGISLGTKLLPVLSKIVGFLSRHETALVDTVLAFAAAWTLVKIGGIISGLNRMAGALLGVRAAAVGATGAAAGLAGAEGAAAGAGAAGAAGAARAGLLTRFPLLKIAIPLAVTYAVTSATGLNKEISDIIHGDFKKAAADAPKWAQETADAIRGALAKIDIHLPGGESPTDKFLGNPKNTQAIQSVATLYGSQAATKFANALRKDSGNITQAWKDVYKGIDGAIPNFFTKKGTVDGQAYGKSVKKSVDANLSSIAAVSKFQDTLRGANRLLDSNTNSLIGNTAGAVSNRKGITLLVMEAEAAAHAYAKSTGKTSDYSAALRLAIPQIEDAAAATGLNREQVDKLITSILGVPLETENSIKVKGYLEALNNVNNYLAAIHQIPEFVTTYINAVATGTTQSVPGGTQGTLGGLLGAGAAGQIPGHAAGGVAKGWAKVGERGTELIHVGSPSAVIPHRETMAALGSGAPLLNIEHWHGDQTDADGLASMLNAKQRAYAASKGI